MASSPRRGAPGTKSIRLSPRAGRTLWLAALLVPPTVFFLVFEVIPMVSVLIYSFYRWEGIGRVGFAGLDNFRRVLFEQPFQGWTINAFRNNVVVFLTLMVVQNGVALFLAILLAGNPRGTRFYQVVFFLPVTLSLVLIGFQWRLFLNPLTGLVNHLLGAVGLGALAQPWLGQESTALFSIIFVSAWRWLGFPTIVFLAAIRSIPQDYFEAARLDGASEWHVARHVIWPLIAPAVTIVVILTFIGTFNWFDLPFVMAGLHGSPARSTDVLALYFYRTAFGETAGALQDFGRGSALAVLLFVFVLVVAVIWTRVLRKREVELT
jgi:raffinose/stachyose/melibiose transport system permease protein